MFKHRHEANPYSCPGAMAHANQRRALSGRPVEAVPHPTGVHPQLQLCHILENTPNSINSKILGFKASPYS